MKQKSLLYRVTAAFAAVLFWLTIWQIAAIMVGKPVLLPSPIETVITLGRLMKSKTFYINCGFSLMRIAIGYVSGIAFGSLLGIFTYRSNKLSIFLAPINALIKTTPVASFIILLLVWIKKGNIPSFTSFLIVTPIIWSSVKASLDSVDSRIIEASNIFGLSPLKKIKYVYLPSIKLKYIASLETSLGLAWKSGIAAEVLCTPKNSIGRELYNSKVYLETGDLFAWTLCVVALSIIIEFAVKKVARRFLRAEIKNDET